MTLPSTDPTLSIPPDGGHKNPPLGIIATNSPTASPSHAFDALGKFALQAIARELLPRERVADCLRKPIPGRSGVEVLHSTELQRATYGSLCTCNSVWTCPVCASKISERRAQLLLAALAQSRVRPVLVTFTFAHFKGMTLWRAVKSLTTAYDDLMRGRWADGLRDRYGWETSIRALEVTHGENGWHPHLHILALFKFGLHEADQPMLHMSLAERWIKHLRAVGADADLDHGVDVTRGNDKVAEYLTKFGRRPIEGWSMVREVAKANVKRAAPGGRTPWRLLADYGQGDQEAGALFQQYAFVFKGRRQLLIPKKAVIMLGLDAKVNDDSDLAGQVLSKFDRLLLLLTREQWKRVLLADQRGPLLEIASAGDADALRSWLLEIGVLP